jgi:hypothetical protein
VSEQWRQELQPTPDCIAIENLGSARTEAEQQHVASCPRCQAELALFESFHRDESTADSQWIAAELQRRLAPPSNVKPFRPRRVFSSLAAAAAAVVVIGAAVWMQNREPSIDTKGTTQTVYRTSRLEAIAPAGDVAAAPRSLQWTAVPEATSYTVQLFEVDRTVLWKGETQAAAVALPAEVVARFAPGKTLLWEVTARRGTEVLATSGMQRFRVSFSGSTHS